MSARYFVSDEAPAGARVENSSDVHRLIAALRVVYPDLREVTAAEYRAHERACAARAPETQGDGE